MKINTDRTSTVAQAVEGMAWSAPVLILLGDYEAVSQGQPGPANENTTTPDS